MKLTDDAIRDALFFGIDCGHCITRKSFRPGVIVYLSERSTPQSELVVEVPGDKYQGISYDDAVADDWVAMTLEGHSGDVSEVKG